MQSSLTKSTSSFLTSSRRHFSRTSSSFSRHKQQQQRHKRKSSFVTKAGAEEEELMQKLMAMIGGGAPAGRPPKGQMIAKESAIKGRDSEMRVTEEHYVLVRWFRSMFVVVVIFVLDQRCWIFLSLLLLRCHSKERRTNDHHPYLTLSLFSIFMHVNTTHYY